MKAAHIVLYTKKRILTYASFPAMDINGNSMTLNKERCVDLEVEGVCYKEMQADLDRKRTGLVSCLDPSSFNEGLGNPPLKEAGSGHETSTGPAGSLPARGGDLELEGGVNVSL